MAYARRNSTRHALPWLLALGVIFLALPENWRFKLRAETYGWLDAGERQSPRPETG